MPINLGPAKLQYSSHTILHYYPLGPLLEELKDLEKGYNSLKTSIENKPHLRRELGNHDKIILHLKSLISNKLFNMHSSAPTIRTKRALYDNIGSLIKLTTGNLDSSDGERYNKILEDLDNKDKILQKQIELQYSLNQEAVKRFDKIIENIEHNEANLNFKIQNLVNITDTTISIKDQFLAKDVLSQLIFLYSSILTILQDLENALTFCKLRTYHPSILKLEDLKSHIKNIKEIRKLNLDSDDLAISELQHAIEVDCKTEPTRISFFLSFPINYETTFELLYLLPIPTYNGHEYHTIIPNSKYFLKSGNIIKALNGPCILGKPYQCLQRNIIMNNNACEREIIINGSAQFCENIKLEIENNQLEFIPAINQYLAVFPKKEILRVETSDNSEIKELQGIFLIEASKGNLYFRENLVQFKSKPNGKPIFMSSEIALDNPSKYSNIKLHLHNLNLGNLDLNQVAEADPSLDRENKIFWKCLNVITFILFCMSIIMYGLTKVPAGIFESFNIAGPEVQNLNPELPSPGINQIYPNIPGGSI